MNNINVTYPLLGNSGYNVTSATNAPEIDSLLNALQEEVCNLSELRTLLVVKANRLGQYSQKAVQQAPSAPSKDPEPVTVANQLAVILDGLIEENAKLREALDHLNTLV